MARRRQNPQRKTLSFLLKSTVSTSALPTNHSQATAQLIGESTQLSNFEIVTLLGRGAFGKVYTVNHRLLCKKYALKRFSKSRLVQKCMATNLLKELEILQQLNHTFIIKLWFTFQDESYIYIVTDFLIGGDLRVHLNSQGRFCESRAKLYICEIALALDYLHKRGIAHRDVKPENILLDQSGHAHLADLNLAIKLDDFPDSLATSFAGTRLYMAPEVIMAALGEIAGYDHRVDWWSLGVCFFEMLYGRCPFSFPASFSSLQVLRLITSYLNVPAHWTSDLRAFVCDLLSPVPERRIDSLNKFCANQYMERINMRHVLQRRTAPVFVPQNDATCKARENFLFANNDDLIRDRLCSYSPLSWRRKRRNMRFFSGNDVTHFQEFPNTANAKIGIDNAKSYSSSKAKRHFSAMSVSISARRVSVPFSAELAHLSLSFREFNRFKTPPLADALSKTQLVMLSAEQSARNFASPFSKYLSSGLLLTQSVKALETKQQQTQERVHNNALRHDYFDLSKWIFSLQPDGPIYAQSSQNFWQNNAGKVAK